MKRSYSMRLACELQEVSVSGYCSWQRRRGAVDAGNARRCSEAALVVHMRAIHAEVKGEYGWPRMHKELLARGLHVGKERVRTLMQRHGIKAKTKRKFVVTTDSKHKLPVAPDLVQRRFAPQTPNQLWCSDITYIHTDEGLLYLAAVMDLLSRQVVGWRLQTHMQTSLVKDAFAMAQWRRRPAPGLILHSDRGSQYCSHEFQGTPENSLCAWTEFATREQARQAVMDWIAFYNHRRLHSTLGYLSPMQYEQRWYEAQRKKAA
jgi:transposase InsO family protein